MEKAIKITNFTKKYNNSKKPAVDNISFSVEKGNFHGFIGANGAGKTTTIKSMIGAYSEFNGKISFLGFDHNSKEAKKIISYIPETAIFPSNMSTINYLKWMGFLSGMSFTDAKNKAMELLKENGLIQIAKKNPNKFSSGQKKSILLIQALLSEPKILIMDEPAANLDPTARIKFFDKLNQLKNKGLTILISSHILSELEKYIDSVTILDGGKVVYSKTLEIKEGFLTNKFISGKDNKKLESVLIAMNLKSKSYKNGFLIEIKNEEEKQKLLKKLADEKISFEVFKDVGDSLEEIYQRYVKIGSNHTEAIKKVGKNA